MMKRACTVWLIVVLFLVRVQAQETYGTTGGPIRIKAQVDSLIRIMTLEEKIGLCAGANPEMAFKGIERLGIPNVQCSDGPRGPNRMGKATAFPSGIAFGASWNPLLVKEAGKVMGEEARADRIGVLLGPACNILRDPLNGRFFEYFTEDPFLNSRLTVANIQGIQGEGVAACLKHYACNNREDNRNFYMSMLDDRTLHEIYLPAFKAAVQEADVWTIMTSANGVNGESVSDSRKMLTDILKDGWGFEGFVLTDWLQTRSTEKAALAGLDVSMPGGNGSGFGEALLEAVKEGRVPQEIIDDKVRRILTVYGKLGVLDKSEPWKSAGKNTVAHQETARRMAEESIVLLKNEKRLLPLDTAKIRTVLVIGPNADKRFCLAAMGGSSGVLSPYEVTALQGLKNHIGDKKVQYLSSDDLGGFQLLPQKVMVSVGGKQGFKASYFVKGKESPAVERIDPEINFMWEMKSPDPNIEADDFTHARYEGQIIPPMDGKYTLRVIVDGVAHLYEAFWGGAPIAVADRNQGLRAVTASVEMKKGKPFDLRIDYFKQPGDAGIRIEWELPDAPGQRWEELDKAASGADAVIFVGGIDHSLDTEGRDRKDMSFPKAQEKLINRLAGLNKNLIAVLINGSPLELSNWLPSVPAVVEAWYPGMEGGNALAKVLTGAVNPSGKLPFSWPSTLQESPSVILGKQDSNTVFYNEKLLLGYRYFDTKRQEPLFPFGYGLSYTQFKYDVLSLRQEVDSVIGEFLLKNIGNVDGKGVIQVYIRPLKPTVDRPVHELKAFQKVGVKKDSTVNVVFSLKLEDFAYYNASKNKWETEPGDYEIEVGSSSRDIRCRSKITIRDVKKI